MVPEDGPSCELGESHVVVDFVKRESKKVDRYSVVTDTGDDRRKHFLKWEASWHRRRQASIIIAVVECGCYSTPSI